MAIVHSIFRKGLRVVLLMAALWAFALSVKAEESAADQEKPLSPGESVSPQAAAPDELGRVEGLPSPDPVRDPTIYGYPEPAQKVYSPGLPPTEPRKRIKRIKVTGCEQIACRTVRSILRQKPTPWWKRDPGEEGFDEFWAEDDRNRIILFYRSKGYYEVEVGPVEVIEDRRGKSVVVVYHIEKEGDPVLVDRIRIVWEDGLHEDRDPARMRDLLHFKEGDPFELEAYQGSGREMSVYYQNQGFYRARVARRAVVDPAQKTAEVTYRITKGVRFSIRNIEVEGTELTDPNVVRRAMKLEEGDRCRRNRVIEDQRQIQRLPIYRTVQVIETVDEETRDIDLTIRVEEADPRQAKVGVGYGAEEEVRVMGLWRHVNLFGGARELTVSARWSMLLEREEVVFVQPNVHSPGDFARVSLERRLETEEAYTHEAWAFSPTYHFILTTYLWAELSYRIEWSRLSKVLDQLAVEEEDLARDGVLSAVSGRLEWADLNSPVNPTQGARAGLYAEVGGGLLYGDFSYYKLIGEARGYYPVFPPLVVAARAKLGYAAPYGDLDRLPLFLRFYTGGTGYVRGFGRYELGPKDAQGRPIGGVRLWEGSVELRFPIWEAIGGVLFMESGWVWTEDEDYDLEDLKHSAGFGIRYTTPIGPLALDLAFPLDQEPGPVQYQIHFNVGHSF